MIGFPIGMFLANAGEWVIHKYVLHRLGRSKKSFWSFHWHEHHRQSRRNGFYDHDYERPTLGWHAQGKEAYALLALDLTIAPLLPVAPFFCAGVWTSSYLYYRLHKKAHLDPEWAREHLPWHYDHHMGTNQDANWCVTHPLFDYLLGTREPYAGTAREERDRDRSARLRSRPAAA
jgi:sterol desaturase/sphingolipid hydroxylase (fatty acid hydroxylase superfamily)